MGTPVVSLFSVIFEQRQFWRATSCPLTRVAGDGCSCLAWTLPWLRFLPWHSPTIVPRSPYPDSPEPTKGSTLTITISSECTRSDEGARPASPPRLLQRGCASILFACLSLPYFPRRDVQPWLNHEPFSWSRTIRPMSISCSGPSKSVAATSSCP